MEQIHNGLKKIKLNRTVSSAIPVKVIFGCDQVESNS